ncbi:MAG TPA: transglycosylase SLT domain-containing protein [Longimicrobiaceae bacterium]|nr:transglycosylase SLT domain-containing protein [Longimicrobiaceae bacterium]
MPPRRDRRRTYGLRRSAARRRRRLPRPRLGRRGWALVLIAVLVAAVPPARHAVVSAAAAVDRAVASAREAEGRERAVDAYARRYGIERGMAEAIERIAREERVPAELAFRLVRVESAFRERAVSPVGAVGLTQLMPATAAELEPGITRERLFDRETNLRLGFRYFRRLLRYYDGDREMALHAYNRGIGTVARIRAEGGDPANGYADDVLGGPGASPVGRVPVDAAAIGEGAHELGPARLPAGM